MPEPITSAPPDALMLSTNGKLSRVNLPDDLDDTRPTLHRVLDCNRVDVVDLDGQLAMWTDADGKTTRPVNPQATRLAHAFGYLCDEYHGPVVFTGGADEDGDTLPLSPGITALLYRTLAPNP